MFQISSSAVESFSLPLPGSLNVEELSFQCWILLQNSYTELSIELANGFELNFTNQDEIHLILYNALNLPDTTLPSDTWLKIQFAFSVSASIYDYDIQNAEISQNLSSHVAVSDSLLTSQSYPSVSELSFEMENISCYIHNIRLFSSYFTISSLPSMTETISENTPSLFSYWKLSEHVGEYSYDAIPIYGGLYHLSNICSWVEVIFPDSISCMSIVGGADDCVIQTSSSEESSSTEEEEPSEPPSIDFELEYGEVFVSIIDVVSECLKEGMICTEEEEKKKDSYNYLITFESDEALEDIAWEVSTVDEGVEQIEDAIITDSQIYFPECTLTDGQEYQITLFYSANSIQYSSSITLSLFNSQQQLQAILLQTTSTLQKLTVLFYSYTNYYVLGIKCFFSRSPL